MSDLNSDVLLDRIILALREEPVPEFVDIPARMKLNRTDQWPATVRIGSRASVQWRPIRRPLMVGAALATVAAVVGFALTIVPVSIPAVLFAEVQDAAAAYKSLRYRVLDFHGDKDPYITTVTSVRAIGSHIEGPNGSEQITNLKDRRMLWLDHRARKATIYQLYLDDGRAPSDVFWEKLLNLPGNAKTLGPAELDGKKVLRFALSDLGEYEVMADADTKRPLRMELKLEKGLPGNRPFREIFTDFVYDAPVRESLFEIHIPSGYAVQRCEEPRDRNAVDVSALIVSPTDGIGPLRMGAPRDAIIKFFGVPDWIESQGRAPVLSRPGGRPINPDVDAVLERLHYNSLGFEVMVSSVRGMTQFRCLSGSSIARKFLGKTDVGIHLGATTDDVINAYGKPEVKSQFRETDFGYPHKGWRFHFRDGKLATMTAIEPLPEEIEVVDNGDGSWSERVKAK